MKINSRHNKGSILVFVLCLIVFLSVLSMRLMKETTQELRHVSQSHRRDDLRTYAYSGLDLVVGVLNEFKTVKGKLESGQGWSDPFEYAEMFDPIILSGSEGNENQGSVVKWNVSLTDESGKIPLSSVKDRNLASFFATFVSENEGSSLFDEEDGRPFVEILRDWEDQDDEERDDGAEDDFYEDLDPPYFTPGRKIEAFDEFKWIKGFGFSEDDPDEKGLFFDEKGMETRSFKVFRDSFSFYNEGTINPYGSSDSMIRILAGDDDQLYEELLEQRSSGERRDREDFFQPMNQLASKIGLKLSNQVQVLRAVITVTRGRSVFKLHAVLSNESSGSRNSANNRNSSSAKNATTKSLPRSERNQKVKYPFRVLALKENENLID